MQIKIRPATQNDAGVAAVLMDQLADYTHEYVDHGVEERFRTIIELPEHALFVAEDENGHVMGLLSISHHWTLWHAGPCAIIEELVVDREKRGHGAGTALIQAGLDWARNQGCSEVEISTDRNNTYAQTFYEQLGFDNTSLLLEYEFD